MNRLIKINWGDGGYDFIEVDTDEDVLKVNKLITDSTGKDKAGEYLLDEIYDLVPSAKVITEEVFEIITDIPYFSSSGDELESDSDEYPDYEEMELNEWRDYADETADENFYTDVGPDIKWIEWPAEDVTVSINRIGDDKNGTEQS